MPEKIVRVCYVEDGQAHRMVLPGVNLPAGKVLNKLKERYPNREFYCFCEDEATPSCICAPLETEYFTGPLDAERKRVRHAMTSPVVSVAMDADLEQIENLLKRYGFRHVPVLGGRGEIMGIISDRDVRSNASPFLGKASQRELDTVTLKKKAHQVMTRNPLTVGVEEPLGEAARRMTEGRVNCLVVVDDDHRLQGIVTSSDLLLVFCSDGSP